MKASELTYVHRYLPPNGDDPRTLLLLHGTGGDENDLVHLGQMLAPDAGLLSPRGNVLENGAARFFRRLAEGVFDIEDLHARTKDLVAFVDASAAQYGFDPAKVVAVGFSNGANIAGSMLLSSPRVLSGAVLFRPMVPFVPDEPVSLEGRRVYIGAAENDPIVSRRHPERLAEMLRVLGADVTLNWQPTGHALTRADVSSAYDWLEASRATTA
ncbi:MAG TPA: alpha/beta hydrolase [Gemmatimonadaceae bacterium]|jgi:predicted esterase|nr:alpha/beta hydrolase [Gemmatimonadaceae bacterium]